LSQTAVETATVLRLPAGRARTWHAPLWASAGLILIAASFALSREGHAGAPVRLLFWVGFVTIVAPIAARLLATSTSRGERIALVCMLGLLAYAVKVLRDPLMFVMSDEFTHLAAAQQIVATHKLFQALPLSGLVASPGYPGLETVTVTISAVTGLSLFVSGLVVIAVARAIIMLALFALYERVSGSARVAGLGALLFAANGNFLYWSSQFSYESLSLPLFVLALALYVRRAERPSGRLSLTLTLVVLIATITATHHLSSYALAATLWIVSLLSLRATWSRWRAFGLAIVASVASLAWFLLVATGTGRYLGFVFERTFSALESAGSGAHTPFQASAGSLQTPVVEQVVSFAGVLLVIVMVLLTLRRVRRLDVFRTPIGIVLAAASVGFLGFYPLRLFPGAWETANRGQEFLFIGVALVLALALVRLARGDRLRRVRRPVLVSVIVVVICGGVISGWPSPLLLSQPLEVRVDHAVAVPQGLSAAAWAIHELPADSIYVGDEATGRELLVAGAHYTLFGNGGDVPAILESAQLPAWQREALVQHDVDYVVLDRRKVAANNQAAYFFQPQRNPSDGLGYYSPGVRTKFEVPTVSRIFDSGDVVIYEVRGLREEPPLCSAVGIPTQRAGITCRLGNKKVTIAGSNQTVKLPNLYVRLLRLEVQRRQAGTYVTVVVRLQNVGTQSFRPEPNWRDMYLDISGHDVYRIRRVPERSDNLDGSHPLAGGATLQGSLTFVVRGHRLVSALAHRGAQLHIRLAREPHRYLGVIQLAAHAIGASE
jgi:hypothetical protein